MPPAPTLPGTARVEADWPLVLSPLGLVDDPVPVLLEGSTAHRRRTAGNAPGEVRARWSVTLGVVAGPMPATTDGWLDDDRVAQCRWTLLRGDVDPTELDVDGTTRPLVARIGGHEVEGRTDAGPTGAARGSWQASWALGATALGHPGERVLVRMTARHVRPTDVVELEVGPVEPFLAGRAAMLARWSSAARG